VIYRTGGTINYRWARTVAYATKAEAELVAEAVRLAGYVAHVENFNLSMSVGLPETYEVGGYPIDPEDWIEHEERQEVLRSMGRTSDDEIETLREFHEDYDRWGNE
jgi:hypothetical protein